MTLGCSCNHTVVRHFPPDPGIPGIVHVDVETAGSDKYWTIDITLAGGFLTETELPPKMAAQKTLSYSTGEMPGCMDEPTAEYRDGTYLARCYSTHTDYGMRDITDIMAKQGQVSTVVWSRSLDPGWSIRRFGWNATLPILAVLVDSSVPQENPLAWILGFFGHPPPDETIHLIIVSPTTKMVRDITILRHIEYGYPRLLGW